MRLWVQVLETTSCRNAGKGRVHKTLSGQTLCKRELRAPGCPFFSQSLFVLHIYLRSISRELYVRLATFFAMYIELTPFCAPQMHPLLTGHVHYTGCSLLLITMIATLNFNPRTACSYLWGAIIVNF
jgi:hypothetical protein